MTEHSDCCFSSLRGLVRLRLIISFDSQGGLSPNQLTPISFLVLTVVEEDPSSVEDEAESLEDDREKLDVSDPQTTPESFRMDSSLGLGMGTWTW